MLIYQIINNLNFKKYIGQTIKDSFDDRWRDHCKKSNANYSIISRAIQKYGKENFIIEVIDYGESIDDLNNKEVFWIDFFNTMRPNGYNIREGGSKGALDEESRKKISKTLTGRKLPPRSEETKEKLRIANTGKIFTKERLENMSKSLKGLPAWNKGKKTGLPSWNHGVPHSEETKEKISKANKGKPSWCKGQKRSEESKNKMRESAKNRPPVSLETRKKQSSIRKGRKLSEEHKQKISESKKGKKREPFSKEWLDNLSKSKIGNQNRKGTPRFDEKRMNTGQLELFNDE